MKILIITQVNGDTKGMYKIEKNMLRQIKKAGAGLKIDSITEKEKNLDAKIQETDILISNDLSLLTSENSTNLKWVHLTSAGANKVPDFIKNSQIIITNSSGVHPIPISEHVFGLMLMLARGIHKAHRAQIEEGKWTRSYEFYRPIELSGKQLLIVGMGRIGEKIAQIAKVFGMNVTGVVRDLKKKRKNRIELFALKDLNQAIKDADFIVSCLPGTEYTKGLFSKSLFKKFKPESYFINIGRGTTVVENDLIDALEKRWIRGAGLDVFEVEPLAQSSKLWKLKNVIITPHYSGWTPSYNARVIDIFCQNLKPYLRGAKLPNLVNKELGY
jgi:D-2-hydroxyacid dehydrogenase (NADP+)